MLIRIERKSGQPKQTVLEVGSTTMRPAVPITLLMNQTQEGVQKETLIEGDYMDLLENNV